jgi:methyl-accepting chemotaxis protein
VAREVGEAAAAQVVFAADDAIVGSTLDPNRIKEFMQREPSLLHGTWTARMFGWATNASWKRPPNSQRVDSPRVRLVVLKSYDEASRYLIRLDRLLHRSGLFVFGHRGALATYISGTITQPLEALVAGARALGSGDFGYELQSRGAKELRELSAAFDQMRTAAATNTAGAAGGRAPGNHW